MKELATLLDSLPDELKELTGFELGEIEDLQLSMVEDRAPEIVPQESEAATVFQFGNHKVYFGVPTDKNAVNTMLQSIEPMIIFADNEIKNVVIEDWMESTGVLPTQIR